MTKIITHVVPWEEDHPLLLPMFKARKAQFVDRLGWPLSVDEDGGERDQYDAQRPLYIIATDPEGNHLGSGRVMPTVAPCMINEAFVHLTGGVAICSPLTWEITRFEVSGTPTRGQSIGRALLVAGLDLALSCGVISYVGVYERMMGAVYKALDFPPSRIGKKGSIFAGSWQVTTEARDRITKTPKMVAA